MARRTTPGAFAALMAAARAAHPEMAITTDLIAGFPGETEAEFEETVDFVKGMRFAGGHVFTYSARPGTAAARMQFQVRHDIRKQRNAILRAILDESAQDYRVRFIGSTLPVLWESAISLGPQGWTASGLTDNYLRVFANTPRSLWNQITPVLLTGLHEHGLEGQLVARR
jgi:threonylcarbamoyladenosine tRNA methylthiotransferase MtaB